MIPPAGAGLYGPVNSVQYHPKKLCAEDGQDARGLPLYGLLGSARGWIGDGS